MIRSPSTPGTRVVTAIRQPAVAGTFYPADPAALRHQITGFLAEAGNGPGPGQPLPKAIIGPHAGYLYSGRIAGRAYARLAAAHGRISRVVLLGPSHYVAFRGLAVDTTDAWETPGGTIRLDTDAIALLRRFPSVLSLESAFAREHALEVHVPFLRQVLGDFRLVPIVAGTVAAETVAEVINALWGGPETLIVISTDLSHYLSYAACQKTDAATAAAIEEFDAEALNPNRACGAVPTSGLLLAARRRGMTIERLDLRNSGDTAGPRDRVVGYGAWALYSTHSLQPENELSAHAGTLLEITRTSILSGFNTGLPAMMTLDNSLPAPLSAYRAAFVTLRRNQRLRGCLGSAVARQPLIFEVAQQAFNAAFRDWRFPKLGLEELAGLTLSVSVLTPPVAVLHADEAELLDQLQPGTDGLIIDDAGHSALFLPSVWHEVPDPRRFLMLLKAKAGLPANQASKRLTARRFRSVEVTGEMTEPTAGASANLREMFRWTPRRDWL